MAEVRATFSYSPRSRRAGTHHLNRGTRQLRQPGCCRIHQKKFLDYRMPTLTLTPNIRHQQTGRLMKIGRDLVSGVRCASSLADSERDASFSFPFAPLRTELTKEGSVIPHCLALLRPGPRGQRRLHLLQPDVETSKSCKADLTVLPSPSWLCPNVVKSLKKIQSLEKIK